MSSNDRLRWNTRFSEGAYQSRTPPSDLLVQHQALLRRFQNNSDAQALDIACGLGRNSRFLIDNGFNVTAVDISDVGLTALRNSHGESSRLSAIRHDLDQGLPKFEMSFDVILKIRFLNETLLAKLWTHLKPGGLVFVEVLMHTEDSQTAGQNSGRFRIRPGALREALSDTNMLHYYEGPITDPDGNTSVVAQAITQRCE